MKKITIWILIAALALLGCAPAMAAGNDRTILHVKNTDGYSGLFVDNVFPVDGGIYVSVTGATRGIRYYADGAEEPVEYLLPEENVEDLMPGEDGTTSYTETVAWFGWKDGLYVIQNQITSGPESNEIDGGYVRKAVMQDGKVQLEECDVPQLDWTNMIEDYGGWKGSRYLNRSIVSGDRLIAQVWDNNGGAVLEIFDLTTGFAQEIYTEGTDDMCAGPDGKILTLQYDWNEETPIARIRMMNPEDQSEEEIATVQVENATAQGLAYDAENHRIFYALNGEIWAIPEDGSAEAQSVTDCPISGGFRAIVLGGQRILLWGQTDILIRDTDPNRDRSEFTLNIQDYIWGQSLNETTFDYTNANGNASVVIRNGGNMESILQDMMNRDATNDIYTLNYESSQFDALRSRGFLADLSGNADVQAAFGKMYPFMQKALEQDGKIIAVPLDVRGNAMGIRMDSWKKLGGTEEELPKTWDQFFDWLNQLPEKLQGTGIPVVEEWTTRYSFRSTIMNTILNQYQAYINQAGNDYAFNTPILRDLLEKLDQVDYDALGIREDENGEEGGMMDYGSSGEEYREPLLDFYTSYTISTWRGAANPLALRFDESTEAVMPVNLTVAFVNPYSQHAEEAARFLAMCMQNLRSETRYSIFADLTEPIRDPYYEENQKRLAEWLEEARKHLEEASEEEKSMWEESVKMYQDMMADNEKNSWMISPEAITSFQQRANLLQPLSYDFTSSLVSSDGGSNFYELWEGYINRQVSAQELLSAIDKKVQMMRLEGN